MTRLTTGFMCWLMMNKSELRKIYKAKRRALSDADFAAINERLFSRFFDELDATLTEIDYLHTYLPITRLREVDTLAIIQMLKKRYSNVGLVLSRTDMAQGTMSNHLVVGQMSLVENDWGIPEPQNTQPFDGILIDVVLVPLLVADKHGHRVGYGKGFYDRFLGQLRPDALKVGLSLFPVIDHIDDTNEHDVPLDLIITP